MDYTCGKNRQGDGTYVRFVVWHTNVNADTDNDSDVNILEAHPVLTKIHFSMYVYRIIEVKQYEHFKDKIFGSKLFCSLYRFLLATISVRSQPQSCQMATRNHGIVSTTLPSFET